MKLLDINATLKGIKLNGEISTTSDRLFIFGRNPIFSLGELVSLSNFHQNTIDFKDVTAEGAIISSESRNNSPQEKIKNNVRKNENIVNSNKKNHVDIEESGSLLKRCQPIGIIAKPFDTESFVETIYPAFDKLFLNEKSPWGLSAYNEQNASDKKDYDLIYEGIKQILKKIGLKKMYFVPFESERALTPQKMIRKDLIKTGFELVLWHREKDIVICLTEQVLDIDALSDRDKNRPFTRPLLLLGLALARTMVNLVNIEKNNQSVTIYDPFCGMGSIVQEAYLLGYQSLGSDIDPSCVERSIKNLQWIGKNFELKEYPEENIFEMDINNPIKEKFENKEIAIVSEPDLLTPLKDYPPMSQAKEIMRKFEANYTRYLENIAKILTPQGICVFIFPQLHTKENQLLSLDIERLIKQKNFQICSFKVNNIQIPAYFVHSWKEPIIERQIVVFKKNND